MDTEVHEMFTYIKLKNFMSFKDVTFDFKNGNKGAKKFISIYGENGSGKSNFVNSIELLRRSIDTAQFVANDEKFQELAKDKNVPQHLIEFILNNVDIQRCTENCRMLECDEETSIEYGFQINNREGYYILSFDNRFLYEKLYYYTGKQSGPLFEIKYENSNIKMNFSNKLFLNKKVELEIRDEINKYWGKHTLLSILNNEREKKNERYIEENYLSYVFDFLNMLQEININCKKSAHSGSVINARKPYNLLKKLDSGKTKVDNEEVLNCSEKILKDFFTQTYADIKDVFYEKNLENQEISYKLYFKKMICGKIRTIDFSKESSGTQQILDILSSLLGAFFGVTVVYDEIDDGIHDLLLKNILMSMMDYITGQIIITTHNTYILETIDIKSVYVITSDYQGNKEVKCLDEFPRIQGTNNPRIMYLKGLFGGVPVVDIVDYDTIIENLKNNSNVIVDGGE